MIKARRISETRGSFYRQLDVAQTPWRDVELDAPCAIYEKSIYIQTARLCSVCVAPRSWPRTVLHEVAESTEPLGEFAERVMEEILRYVTDDGALKANSFASESFVYRAGRLDRQGRTDTALDLIYDSTDALLRNGQFLELDSLLGRLKIDELSADTLLAVLTATLPARSKLPSRAKLFREIEEGLRNRGEFEQGLLTGLE